MPQPDQTHDHKSQKTDMPTKEPLITFDAFQVLLGEDYCKKYSEPEMQRLYDISMAFSSYAYKSWLSSRKKMVE